MLTAAGLVPISLGTCLHGLGWSGAEAPPLTDFPPACRRET